MVVICKYCNKEYASYASRSNHIKRKHNTIVNQMDTNVNQHDTIVNQMDTNIHTPNKSNEFKCKICDKKYYNRQALWKHNKKCKPEDTNQIYLLKKQLKEQDNKIKEELKKRDDDIELLKKQMIELMNKQNKIHPKTLTKINKQLNNTLNDNKVINNNINIIALGGESLDTLFSKNKQIDILNHKYQCLPHLIKEVHFNDSYPQFKNILITNTQNTIAYKYDKYEKKFIAIDKNDLLDDIILERMGDIETFYDNNITQLDAKTKNIIETFIEKMDNNEEYKETKKKEIKLIIYNNRNKVSKEITQDLEVIV